MKHITRETGDRIFIATLFVSIVAVLSVLIVLVNAYAPKGMPVGEGVSVAPSGDGVRPGPSVPGLAEDDRAGPADAATAEKTAMPPETRGRHR